MMSYTDLIKCAALCLFMVASITAQANAKDDDLVNLVGLNPGFEEDHTDWWQGVQGGAEATHDIDDKDAITPVKDYAAGTSQIAFWVGQGKAMSG